MSTEERLFDVIFEGKTLNDVSLEQAINALSKLSRKQPDDVAPLFNGHPTPVKNRVPKEIALQYRQALIDAGLACRINKTEPPVETIKTEKPLDHDVNFSKREKVDSQEKIAGITQKENVPMNDETNTDSQSIQHDFVNYEKYAEFTRSRDWQGICEINGLGLDSFGTKKELKVLEEYLEDDEVVFCARIWDNEPN